MASCYRSDIIVKMNKKLYKYFVSSLLNMSTCTLAERRASRALICGSKINSYSVPLCTVLNVN